MQRCPLFEGGMTLSMGQKNNAIPSVDLLKMLIVRSGTPIWDKGIRKIAGIIFYPSLAHL
jgi:hypothetical protein